VAIPRRQFLKQHPLFGIPAECGITISGWPFIYDPVHGGTLGDERSIPTISETTTMLKTPSEALIKLNARLGKLLNKDMGENVRLQSAFARSLAELKHDQERERAIAVASPRASSSIAKLERVNNMGLTETICAALTRAEEIFNCSAPTTPLSQKLCPAISRAKSSLGCGVIVPPQGCDVTGCTFPTTYCEPITNSCMKQPVGGTCTTPDECDSGNCDYGTCQAPI